jgi:hypothetical protein
MRSLLIGVQLVISCSVRNMVPKKEGQPLMWEDARRVVFQTALVMFEVDATLARGKAR